MLSVIHIPQRHDVSRIAKKPYHLYPSNIIIYSPIYETFLKRSVLHQSICSYQKSLHLISLLDYFFEHMDDARNSVSLLVQEPVYVNICLDIEASYQGLFLSVTIVTETVLDQLSVIGKAAVLALVQLEPERINILALTHKKKKKKTKINIGSLSKKNMKLNQVRSS